MKKLPLLIVLTAGMIFSSCQKKKPDFVNIIPDDAFAVISFHPMDIHEKGQLNTLENLKGKIEQDFLKELLEDPSSSGLLLDEYAYVFVTIENDDPGFGAVAGMKDVSKFENLLKSIDEEVGDKIVQKEGFKMISHDDDVAIGWNDKQMILLSTPDQSKDEETWAAEISRLLNLTKEESLTSMVDFNDFLGDMKDLNAWVSSDKLVDLFEHLEKDVHINLPVQLYNNYQHIFCEFENGAMYVNGKTNFSEEVEKNVEEVLVMKNALNKDMLELAPGGNLLLAMAGAMDLEKFKNLMEGMAPPEAEQLGDKIEESTGIKAEELWKAFTGDFVIVINGIEEESMIPVEIFIGLGIDNEAIQDQLMGTVENMTEVQKEGDFFIINAQGMELYSGIVKGIWVITNSAGYNKAIKGSGLEKSLPDTKFRDFAGKSMGMYLNLDLSSYPAMIQQHLSQNPSQQKWLEYLTESFTFLGMSAGNYSSSLILETNKPDENSLYTILKMTDIPE